MKYITLALFSMFLATTLQPLTAETYIDDWTDSARDRTVPVRIYLPPGDVKEKCPVMLLSHGLGGSREGFPYLGDYWSRNGYIVVVMQHPGSDTGAIKRKPGKTVTESMSEAVNYENGKNRVDDVGFVLDELKKRNESDEKLKGRLDLDKIGIGGHSFGSHTTLCAVGRAPYPPDPRLKAAIAMSPAMPPAAKKQNLFRKVKVPVLHLTGTKDSSPIQKNLEPIDRRIPYDQCVESDQYLVIFKDGNHMLFSGHKRPFGNSTLEKEYQPKIQALTLKFLDAYLRGDEKAKAWLKGKDFVDFIGDGGTVEHKP